MNIKIASRLVYILYMISLVLVFTTLHASHLTRSIAISVFIALSCIYMIIRLKVIRNKTRTDPSKQVSSIQKVLNNIIIASAFGVLLALVFIIWHIRYIGMPLLNISLATCITGFIGLMAVPPKPNSVLNTKHTRVYSAIICLSAVCTLIGLLLRVNHYPYGKQLMFGGLAFLVITMILFIIYAKYIKKKSTV